MKAPFTLRPTSTPRIFTIAFEGENRATLALGPEMSAAQLIKWRRFVEAALNTAYQSEGMRADPSGLPKEGES